MLGLYVLIVPLSII